MNQWSYIIIGLCLLLLAFLLWKEVQRDNNARLAARIIATMLAVASLACMALPLSVARSNGATGTQDVVLLTEGYEPDSLRAFLKTAGNVPVYTLPEYINAHPGAEHLHVFGYGLSTAEWQQLPAVAVVQHPMPAPAGITAISWQQQLTAGETLHLQGNYNNTTGKPVKLVLSGLHAALDSVMIKEREQQSFTLQTVPKHSDRAVFSLMVLSGKDTIQQEPVPVTIQPAAALRILFLAAAPGPENRFLSNWLSQNGYNVAMRTTISTDKYDNAFFNMPRTPLEQLNASLLDKFDIVLGDAAIFQSLGNNELASLRQQVEQKGLGMVIRADSAFGKTAFYSSAFPLTVIKDSTRQAVSLQLAGSQVQTAPIATEQPVYINLQPGTQPLVQDTKEHILASSSLLGAGKLVLVTLDKSYSWMLAGNTADYQRLWALLLQKAARKVPVNTSWRLTPQLPRAQEPVQLYIETTTAVMPQVQVQNTPVALARNPIAGFEWQGTYWPAKAGWHTAVTATADTCRWFAFTPQHWKNIYQLQKQQDTRHYTADEIKSVTGAAVQSVATRVPISKAWFFITFLVCCTFLWIERKI